MNHFWRGLYWTLGSKTGRLIWALGAAALATLGIKEIG